jgi:hypothetical protein
MPIGGRRRLAPSFNGRFGREIGDAVLPQVHAVHREAPDAILLLLLPDWG